MTIGLFVLALIVAAGIGLALARNRPVEAGLVVDAGSLDFGTVWEVPEYRHSFTLTNPTEKPIRVADFQTGCGCTTVEPRSFTVQPGGKQELSAVLNLTGYGGKAFTVDLLPQLAHQPPGQRTVWTLKGDVQSNPIVLSESSIDFGEAVILGEPLPMQEIEVSLSKGAPFDELRASVLESGRETNPSRDRQRATNRVDVAQNRFLKGEARIVSVGPRRWQLQVEPHAGLPAGPFEFTVRIEPTGGIAKPLPYREITVAGSARHDIAAWPTSVNFGVLEVGETAREYVVLASHRGRPFEVTRIEAPEGINVTPAAEQLGDGSRTFVVEGTTAAVGAHSATIVFHIQHSAPEPGELTIPVKTSFYATGAREP